MVEESEQGEIKNLGLEVQGKTILKIEEIILEKIDFPHLVIPSKNIKFFAIFSIMECFTLKTEEIDFPFRNRQYIF